MSQHNNESIHPNYFQTEDGLFEYVRMSMFDHLEEAEVIQGTRKFLLAKHSDLEAKNNRDFPIEPYVLPEVCHASLRLGSNRTYRKIDQVTPVVHFTTTVSDERGRLQKYDHAIILGSIVAKNVMPIKPFFSEEQVELAAKMLDGLYFAKSVGLLRRLSHRLDRLLPQSIYEQASQSNQ